VGIRGKAGWQGTDAEPSFAGSSIFQRIAISTPNYFCNRREPDMPDSVYKVIELVGSSPESWEKAVAAAVKQASNTLRDLRIAEVVQLDAHVAKDGSIEAYRAKIRISFKLLEGEQG
jgi:dodecin